MTKDEIINGLLDREAGYVNHPSDKGGPTNWVSLQRPPWHMVTVTSAP